VVKRCDPNKSFDDNLAACYSTFKYLPWGFGATVLIFLGAMVYRYFTGI